MRVLIGYATSEGQTRKIARFAADRLTDAGQSVELLHLADAEGLDLGRFDGAVLGGSLHAGSFQKELKRFAADHAGALNGMPTLFLPVSLAAAGDSADDWEGLNAAVADLTEATGWSPGRIAHVAGAFRFSEYNFLETWVMRWIAAQKDQGVDGTSDREYTDWSALGALLDDWTAGLRAGKEAAETA